MENRLIGLISTVILSLGFVVTASATLVDRGNGMIYDSDQDITWLQDANYAQTSGYDSDGIMSWVEANDWAAGLSYGGYDDWRLSSIVDKGNDGCNSGYSGTDCGYNVDTSGSELAYMWYDILGNTPYGGTSGNYPQSGWGLHSTSADGVDILNFLSCCYWSSSEYFIDTALAWGFQAYDGLQGYADKNHGHYAWAVRSGDVVPVPEPGTVLLLAAAGLAGFARRRC